MESGVVAVVVLVRTLLVALLLVGCGGSEPVQAVRVRSDPDARHSGAERERHRGQLRVPEQRQGATRVGDVEKLP